METIYNFEIEENDRFGFSSDDDLNYLIETIEREQSELDIQSISTAFNLCLKAHSGQIRGSGKPYYTHPLKVTLILLKELKIKWDTAVIAASLLHDTIEDTKDKPENERVNEDTILKLFPGPLGSEILKLVLAVTKIKHEKIIETFDEIENSVLKNYNSNAHISAKALTYRKLFLALLEDSRVMVIKLADRLHNMRTIHYMNEKKRSSIAYETLNFYTPIAYNLGMMNVNCELEDLSLYNTDKIMYERIRKLLWEKRIQYAEFIFDMTNKIEDFLNSKNLDCTVIQEHKHFYEIYRMISAGYDPDSIENFYSLIIQLNTNDSSECFKVLGLLMGTFRSSGLQEDAITHWGKNWFKYLKTNLIGPDGTMVEVLIRTSEMGKIADEGILTTLSVNSKQVRPLEISNDSIDEWGNWMMEIIESKSNDADGIIWNSIRNNLYNQGVNVFLKDGRSFLLPPNSTPVDLAFEISEKTGFKIISVKVNNLLKDLNYQLQTGDRVEIITSENGKPDKNWQDFVVHYKAVIKLHNYFKNIPNHIKQIDLSNKPYEVALHIMGNDRPGMLLEITQCMGEINIGKIRLSPNDDDEFEGVITITVPNKIALSHLIFKLGGIKGIKKIEEIQSLD
ncbi:MAG: HD domain-containing protein [Candidatus Kapabacteria bacterium]|nr:HD domain-containing protein [Candidatus Kapabacteria bacterium]